jgi:hypothetical protein
MKRLINFIGTLHHKNIEGAKLFNNEWFDIEFNGSSRDIVIHTSDTNPPIGNLDVYGPQIDFRIACQINSYQVNFLSDWNLNMAKELNHSIKAIKLPFPVNTEKFKPSEKTDSPIIYFKRRNLELIKQVVEHLIPSYPNLKIFSYEDGYEENKYIEATSIAPFCVWVGAHESQGFALQECLSSNTPILVIDIDSMHDEISKTGTRYWGREWRKFKATSAPYFDETCGMITNESNWLTDFDIFINKLSSYNTRKYVLDNLSQEALSKLWKTQLL